MSAKRTIERRWLRQNAQSQGFFVGADVLGGPCMSRHTQSERIGDFAGCTNSPILFSCLSPMPPGGDKPPPLRQRRRCGANIHGDARIRPGAAGILRRFQLRSHDAPSGSGLRAARNHLPRRGRQGRPTPAGRGEPSAARYAFLCTARWTGGAKQMNKRAADQWSALRECGQGMCGHNSIPLNRTSG